MKKERSYYEQREIKCIERIEIIIAELPPFVRDFFVGIESRTSSLSRMNYAYDLRIFFDFLSKKLLKGKDIDQITLVDLANLQSYDFEYFLNYLSSYYINGKIERCTETGKARKLSTLRAFYKYFFNKNLLPANTPTKVLMPKIHEKEIIRLETNEKKDEVSEILAIAESGIGLTKRQKSYHESTAKRDTAILTLFLGTGIRISELIGLNVADVDFRTNSFVVTRKGGNRTILYFNDEVAQSLSIYLNSRSDIKRENEGSEPLFLSIQNKRIATRTVQELVKKYARIASPLKKITPHKLRSTFGTNLYRETGDIYVVADCLGHKDVNTTRRHYAAISEDSRKSAAQRVSLNKKSDF